MFSIEAQPSEHLKLPNKRLVSGGIDEVIKIWENLQPNKFDKIAELKHHKGWIRDVAWCNNIGLAMDMIASCSEDGSTVVWKKGKDEWEPKVLVQG